MASDRVQVSDRILGLKSGADDYLTKPYDPLALLARIEALLRRIPSLGSTDQLPEPYSFGEVRVMFRRGKIWRDGRPLNLSSRLFQLLRFFVENRGYLLPRERLLRGVWGEILDVLTKAKTMPAEETLDLKVLAAGEENTG